MRLRLRLPWMRLRLLLKADKGSAGRDDRPFLPFFNDPISLQLASLPPSISLLAIWFRALERLSFPFSAWQPTSSALALGRGRLATRTRHRVVLSCAARSFVGVSAFGLIFQFP